MTQILYTNNIHGFSLSAEGHADYGEHGKDIVCAGISTLTSLLLNAGLKANRKGFIRRFQYTAAAGNIHISWRYSKLYSLYDTVELVLDGLKEIAEQYPENVQITKISGV